MALTSVARPRSASAQKPLRLVELCVGRGVECYGHQRRAAVRRFGGCPCASSSTITVGLCIGCACAVALTASALAGFQASDQRVSVVSLDGAPLKLVARIVSAADPPGIAYEATNLTNSVITDYGVRIYVYRSNGRPQGFTTKHEEPKGLQPGASYSSIASLGEIALAADSVVLVQVARRHSIVVRVGWPRPMHWNG